MKYFRELEPDIHLGVGALRTEEDGREWVAEYDRLLERGRLMVVIVRDGDRPLPPAGKPMILWMKARKAELGRLVAATVYVMEDREEREAMERALPGRSKASPYPMMLAVSEEEALQKARAVLSGALPG
jgi:hypothetical protein